jgi:hypothetical protein
MFTPSNLTLAFALLFQVDMFADYWITTDRATGYQQHLAVWANTRLFLFVKALWADIFHILHQVTSCSPL